MMGVISECDAMKTSTKTIDLKTVLIAILFVGLMYACYALFFLSLGRILKVALKTDSNKLIELGFYGGVAIIVCTVLFTQIRRYLNSRTNTISFYNSRRTWRFTWIIGGLLSLLAYLVDHHILFLNWYFLAVGLIPLFNSFFKYAELNDIGITIYYGIFFNRKKLELSWFQISDIGIKTEKEMGTVSAGGRVWVSSREEYEKDRFLIQLKNPLTQTLCEALNNSNRMNLFVNEYEINEKRTAIKLNTEPQEGFDILSYKARKLLFPDSELEKPMSRALFYSLETFGFIVFFLIMIMQLFVWFVSYPK